MPQLPTSAHDWALWLFEHLEEVEFTVTNWQGRLPAGLDFDAIVEVIPELIRGLTDIDSRIIEFHPELGHVYSNMAALVRGAQQRNVPAVFTVRDLEYTHGRTESVPELVRNYLDTVKLWQLLKSFADYEINHSVAFIKSYELKIEIRPEYSAADLISLSKLVEFGFVYFEANHHREQKRNIVRSSLLEVCKGLLVVRLADFLPKFDDFVDRVKASYSLYTADFSFEKLRSEVDSKNVEDTLRLNKTLAEIQNQLLALPAALLVAGAGLKENATAANFAIWLGVTVFALVMRELVINQQNSVSVIGQEAQLRIEKVTAQPADISNRVMPLFTDLRKRLLRQSKTLKNVERAVWVIWIFVTILAINAQWPDVFPYSGNWIAEVAREGREHLFKFAGRL